MAEAKHPKELLCELHASGRRLVEFVVALKNVLGAIGAVAGAMSEMGVNILSGFHSALAFVEEGSGASSRTSPTSSGQRMSQTA